MTRINGKHARTLAAMSAAAIAGGLLTSSVSAQPELTSYAPVTERLTFDGAVSMTVNQRLDGLDPQEVEIADATHLVITEFTIQPGGVFPWHTHPATVLIGINEGDFVFVFAEDCVQREYAAGSALVDPGDTVHTAYNPSEDSETVVVGTFLGAPAEGDLTLPVDEDEAAALDERCGIETPGAHAQ
jgi:quercetin dioxygenase-like cupin family protein